MVFPCKWLINGRLHFIGIQMAPLWGASYLSFRISLIFFHRVAFHGRLRLVGIKGDPCGCFPSFLLKAIQLFQIWITLSCKGFFHGGWFIYKGVYLVVIKLGFLWGYFTLFLLKRFDFFVWGAFSMQGIFLRWMIHPQKENKENLYC